ncbi:MAG: hypothetical protein JWN52_4063 [Actinomycetia bacterium]|nr:hypothetical protein [Actinomycetes bacterium]
MTRARETVVVVSAGIPNTGYLAEASAERISMYEASDNALTDRFRRALDDRQAVIVLRPAWLPVPKPLRMARALLESDRIADVPLSVPPLALSLIADQLAFLAPYVAAGRLASLAGTLSREISAGAWVRSVAKLEHLPVGISHHLASYAPGGGFVVSVVPEPGIQRLPRTSSVMAAGFRPAGPVQMLAAQEGADHGWFLEVINRSFQPSSVTLTGAQPLSRGYWGSGKYLEFVALSGHPDALSRAVSATRCRPCGWCGEPIAMPCCPFCGAAQPNPPVIVPSEPAPGPVRLRPVPTEALRSVPTEARSEVS